MANDEWDFTKLNKLLKGLKDETPFVKVGILGDKNSRHQSGTTTNAEIGRKHEYGVGVPMRSFLRMPIIEKLQSFLDNSNAFDEAAAKEVLKLGNFKPWLKKIGIVAEATIAEAFHTCGFGKWQRHAPGYTNNTGMVLVDTQQLRDSISSEVR